MIAELVRRAHDAGLVTGGMVHTRELVAQLDARTSIGTVVTAQSGDVPKCDLLLVDECHHYVADDWGRISEFDGMLAGFTATPERADGRPLGNLFDQMVVAIGYEELVRRKLLVPVEMVRPDEFIGPDLACDPAEGWLKYAPAGGRGIVYCSTVDQCYEVARDLNRMGVEAAVIEGETDKDLRDALIEQFRKGRIKVLVNVYVLTEGLDVPEVNTILLARSFGHVSTYLQACGRGLRAAKGKEFLTLIDLPGVTWVHGSPIEDRFYSLSEGIVRAKDLPVVQCPRCGFVARKLWRTCAKCGFEMPVGFQKAPKYMSLELRKHWAGKATDPAIKQVEWDRLLATSKSVEQAVYLYKRTFNELPKVNDSGKITALRSLVAKAEASGYKVGRAYWQFKSAFGHWPTPFMKNAAQQRDDNAEEEGEG